MSDELTSNPMVSSEVPSLELAQLFIQANKLIADEQHEQARELLEQILEMGNASQKDIAKELMLKVDNTPSPLDALALTSVEVGQIQVDGGLSFDTQIVNTQADTQQRQGFRVGALNLMMHYADGSELTDLPSLYHVPNAPSWVLGTVNLHGIVIPVFDLVDYFSVDASENAKPMMLILSKSEDAIGVIVNGLPQRLRFDEHAQQAEQALAPDSVRPFVKGAVMINDELWFDLDVQALLAGFEARLSA